MVDRFIQGSCGVDFVTFATGSDEAQKATAAQPASIQGRQVEVNLATLQEEQLQKARSVSLNGGSDHVGVVSDESRWIESESLRDYECTADFEEGMIPECFELFAEPDPMETFSFCWQISDSKKIQGNELIDENIIDSSISKVNDDDSHSKRRVRAKTIKIELLGYKAELGQTLHSTGLTLWRASDLLCNFMICEQENFILNKTILELGSGLGLCGILAHGLEASLVVLTDGDTDTLANLRGNIKRNRVDESSSESSNSSDTESMSVSKTKIHCKQLVWGNDKHIRPLQEEYDKFDIIMGSDIIYVEEILDPLWNTVSQLLDPTNGTFILSYARRNVSIDLVLNSATHHGYQCNITSLDQDSVILFRKK